MNESAGEQSAPGRRGIEPAGDVVVRALREADWGAVLRIYGEGIATGNATFTTLPVSAPSACASASPVITGFGGTRC